MPRTEAVIVAVNYAPPGPKPGRPNGMALAAKALLDEGLEDELGRIDLVVQRVVRVEAPSDDPEEALPAVAGQVADAVAEAVAGERFPIVLGDCSSAVGGVAGLARVCPEPALVWCDAHADLNTPETSPSGYFGGMPVATIVGRGAPAWLQGARGKEGPAPVSALPEERVALVGVRELDAGEQAVLEEGKITFCPGPVFADAYARGPALVAVRDIARGGRGLYFHVDIDVLDPQGFPYVYFPLDEGLAPGELMDLARLCRRGRPTVLGVASFDPLATASAEDGPISPIMALSQPGARRAAQRLVEWTAQLADILA